MRLDELSARASELFPRAVKSAITNPGSQNQAFDDLHQLCGAAYEALGFSCHADCFAEVVPKKVGELSLLAWSRAELEISGWKVDVTMRPFYLGARYVHFEIRHEGPLPGLTETGYRSHFAPLSIFAELSAEEFLAELIPQRASSFQLTLF